MKRTVIVLTAALACLALTSAAPARAMMIAPAPMPVRVAQADAIVVGKLGKVEEKNVSATSFPGAKDKVDYQVLSLKVEEGILGLKKGAEIRLGFVPPPMGGGLIRPGGRRGVVYSTGQEGLFFLTKHHDENFYLAPMYFSFTDKQNANFAKDLELTKRCVKLLEEPMTSLKSKDAEDRLLTAAMLISRYRQQFRPGDGNPPKTEAVPADESKLVLNILAESDWAPAKPGQPNPLGYMTPMSLFYQLGATDKDGWVPPKNPQGNQMVDLAKKWVKEHADTYRIQRFVHAKDEK
jgi:hypothetical protein